MNPQDDYQLKQSTATNNDTSLPTVVGASANDQQAASQQAVADIIRSQLENIYSGNSGENTPHTTPVSQPSTTTDDGIMTTQTTPTPAPAQASQTRVNNQATAADQQPTQPTSHGMRTAPPAASAPTVSAAASNDRSNTSAYQRTMSTTMQPQQPTKEQWREYHSAWQKYYQLYYERYYLNSLQNQQTAEQQKPQEKSDQEISQPIGSSSQPGSLTQKEAMKELRESIRQKVIESSNKAKKSRHFKPILAGIGVLLLFTFLQYNTVMMGMVAAYVSPGDIDPQNIIVDPNANIAVSPEPRMIIPKINVDAPVVYGVGPDYTSQMNAMKQGIAHFSIPGANAVPGQVGNAVFAAHSSNDVFASGDYKFVFAQNEKLVEGDVIYMNYEGTRYTYSITSMEVVLPSEVSKVQIDTNKPMLTLVSCVPLGTAQKRLLVFAEQISPDPTGANVAESSETAPEAKDIPGQPAPTLLQRLFGAR